MGHQKTRRNGSKSKTRMGKRKTEKEDDKGFKETSECNVDDCVVVTTEDPQDLVTIPDPDTFMDGGNMDVEKMMAEYEDVAEEAGSADEVEAVEIDEVDVEEVVDVEESASEEAEVEVSVTEKTEIGEPKIEEPKIEEPKVEEPKIDEPKIETPENTENTKPTETPKSAETTILVLPTNSTESTTPTNATESTLPTNGSYTTPLLITVKEVSIEDIGEDEMCDGVRCGCHKNKCWSYCTKLNFLWCWLDDPVEEGKNEKECETDEVCGRDWRCKGLCGL